MKFLRSLGKRREHLNLKISAQCLNYSHNKTYHCLITVCLDVSRNIEIVEIPNTII